jgi:hypothetical protein
MLNPSQFGELSISYINGNKPIADTPDRLPIVPPLTLFSNYSDRIWDFDTYAQYVFMDIPAASDTMVSYFYTNRSIISESSCYSRPENVTINKDGTVQMMDFTTLEPKSTKYLVIPNYDGTTLGCGDRCAIVEALENDSVSGFYYFCNVTISNVANTTRGPQQLSNFHAMMAAQSIALDGYGYGNASTVQQAQIYDDNFIFGTYMGGDTSSMERLLRLYSISTIASADIYNLWVPDPAPGLVPDQGVKLELDHPIYIEAILGGIGGFHFVIFILAAYFANKVVVIEDSYLAIALLLRPILDKLQGRGSLLGKKEICRALRDPEVSYGLLDRHTETQTIKHLEISEDCGKPSGGWMGWYN